MLQNLPSNYYEDGRVVVRTDAGAYVQGVIQKPNGQWATVHTPLRSDNTMGVLSHYKIEGNPVCVRSSVVTETRTTAGEVLADHWEFLSASEHNWNGYEGSHATVRHGDVMRSQSGNSPLGRVVVESAYHALSNHPAQYWTGGEDTRDQVVMALMGIDVELFYFSGVPVDWSSGIFELHVLSPDRKNRKMRRVLDGSTLKRLLGTPLRGGKGHLPIGEDEIEDHWIVFNRAECIVPKPNVNGLHLKLEDDPTQGVVGTEILFPVKDFVHRRFPKEDVKKKVLRIAISPPPLYFDIEDAVDAFSKRPIYEEILRQQGREVYLFLHGYNIESGRWGVPVRFSDYTYDFIGTWAEGHKAPVFPYLVSNGNNLFGLEKTIATDFESPLDLCHHFGDMDLCARLAYTARPLQDPMAEHPNHALLNGTGGKSWYVLFEWNLNLVRGFDRTSFAKYHRVIAVHWPGDVGALQFGLAEDVAYGLGTSESCGLVRLIEYLHQKGFQITLIAHSLGSAIAFNAMEYFGRTAPSEKKIKHFVAWQAAVPNRLLELQTRCHLRGHFKDYAAATRASETLVVLAALKDDILRGAFVAAQCVGDVDSLKEVLKSFFFSSHYPEAFVRKRLTELPERVRESVERCCSKDGLLRNFRVMGQESSLQSWACRCIEPVYRAASARPIYNLFEAVKREWNSKGLSEPVQRKATRSERKHLMEECLKSAVPLAADPSVVPRGDPLQGDLKRALHEALSSHMRKRALVVFCLETYDHFLSVEYLEGAMGYTGIRTGSPFFKHWMKRGDGLQSRFYQYFSKVLEGHSYCKNPTAALREEIFPFMVDPARSLLEALPTFDSLGEVSLREGACSFKSPQ